MVTETPSSTGPTLHMLCGKIASGKSTLAATLSQNPSTILISEDFWLAGLFGAEMASVADYVRYSHRLRDVMAPHVAGLLKQGLSVVLDFPANTPELRHWMREIFTCAEAAHVLHFLDVADESCKQRLRLRNQAQSHEFSASDAQFEQITAYFVPPQPDENFHVVRYGPD
ncbi:cell division protein ZipA [Thalassospira sp. TSL5-1]|nr:cell division protein ZipA [Thalassospira sp. TSL5-1]